MQMYYIALLYLQIYQYDLINSHSRIILQSDTFYHNLHRQPLHIFLAIQLR